MPAHIKPPENPSEPTTMRAMIPMRSVTRSAMTIGAVVTIGTSYVSWRTTDLKTSPTLPGVTVRTKPERNVRTLSVFGTRRIPRRAR
jgi:hypothetical protein